MTQKTPKPPEVFERPPKLRVAYVVYQVLIHLLIPVYLAVVLWRSRKEPLYRKNLNERFGFWPRSRLRPVWIFAASLGETRAISPVVRLLIDAGHSVTLTHTSPAGMAAAQRLFSDDISAGRLRTGYAPLDLFWCVNLFLRRQNPQIGVVVEMEIWPGLIFEAHRHDLPMIKANGNYIQSSLDKDRTGVRFGLRPMLLSGFSRILTKSETRRATYLQAGVPDDRIRLVGELKFDQVVEPTQVESAMRARAGIADPKHVFMIASSVEAEEEQLFTLVETLLSAEAPPIVVWVPRSPQRFAAIAEALQDKGIRVARRSSCFNDALEGEIPPQTDVLVGDSLGEMTFYYGLSDLVFVGASLVDHGGHNIMEPLAQGKPVLMGPSYFSVAFPADDAHDAGAFDSLPNAAAIAERVLALFSSNTELEEKARAAASFNEAHKGAATRSVAEMEPYMIGPIDKD